MELADDGAVVTFAAVLASFDRRAVVGHGIVRASGRLERMTKARVVQKYQTYNGRLLRSDSASRG